MSDHPNQPPSDSDGDALETPAHPIKTLADVLACLEQIPRRDRRHIEMKSAICKMGDVLRRPLIDVPADPAELRQLIAGASRASAGLSKERWSRVRSLTLAALRDLGVDLMPGRDTGGLDHAWATMAAELPTKALRTGLSRFLSFCSRAGMAPGEVTLATFANFETALLRRSLKQSPEAIYRRTVRLWNQAAGSVPGWPPVEVPLETHPRFYSLAWESFPPSFAQDVEAFLTNSSIRDEFDALDEDYVRPVKASTVEVRRRQIRQLASVLVASGFPIDKLTSLAVLVEVPNARAALRTQRERQGGVATASLGSHAWLLCTIARHWVKSPGQSADLIEIARRLNRRPKGMTDRNRARLRQFDTDENTLALLELPDRVVREVKRSNTGSEADARRVMLAIAVELLIVAPMRVGNLVRLEQERHLPQPGRGRHRKRHIVIPAVETKNETPFDMELPDDSAALLDIYLTTYRHRLCAGPSAFLFPNENGERRSTIPFSRALTQFIERETGLQMHAHLFRHLAGKIILDENPNDTETARRVLGHRSSATTIRYYLEHRTGQAFRRYDDTIGRLRAASTLQTKSGSRKRKKVAANDQ